MRLIIVIGAMGYKILLHFFICKGANRIKQSTLEDLFYCNINPCEISFVRDSEYGKCFDKVTELSKSICSQLSEEYINKLNELESAYTRILSETEREYFISDFKLGAKIMTEVYNGRSSTFRET